MPPDWTVQQPEQVAGFFQKHRTGLVTLVFTDLADSTALLHQLGDQAGTTFLRQRRQILREVLHTLSEAEEIETAGDSFLLVFAKPSDAVRFALVSQARLRTFSLESGLKVQERMGIHLGEVVISEHETEVKSKDLYGIQLAACARVMSLAVGGQVLLTRGAFDSARQVLKGEDLPGVGGLRWVSHGPYLLKGIEEPVEVCEVAEAGETELVAPKTSEKAQRQVRADEEPVLGWRPAVGQVVPNTRWQLEAKLGEGGFGEVWLGRNPTTKEARVFKFCFQSGRVRFLKRELTLFRLLKERVGDHPNIVRLHDVYLDQPPFYVEMDYVAGHDLRAWCEQHGGVDTIPMETRLEIVVQVADALQAAHEAGVIHRDIKPANILVGGQGKGRSEIQTKLTDFGIGQVVSEEYLSGITRAGFTQTILSDSSSSRSGTQLYLAPELVAGQPASTRSDIYSLGVVLYQLLVADFSRPVTTDWERRIEDPLLREDLKGCFAGETEDRFGSAAELAKRLRALPQRRRELTDQQAALAAAERAAYRRGIVRTAGIATVTILAIGGLAVQAIRSELKSRKLAEERRQDLYVAQVGLAHQAWEEGNLQRAQQLLQAQRPLPKQEDLRGFEWRYLARLCQDESTATFTNLAANRNTVAFTGDGKGLLVAAGTRLKRFDIATLREQVVLDEPEGIQKVVLSPTNPNLAATVCGKNLGGMTNVLKICDLGRRQVVASYPHFGEVTTLVFSGDGKILASCSLDQLKIRLWGIASQNPEPIHTLRPPAAAVAMAFSRDGKYVVCGYLDSMVYVLDSASGEERGPRLEGHTDWVQCLALSPDGKLLASAGDDSTIIVWDFPGRRRLYRLVGHTGRIHSVTFSPNGRLLASAGIDRVIRIWDLETRRQISIRRGHSGDIAALAFSPDGSSLASIAGTDSSDGTVKLWSLKSPEEADTLRGHRHASQGVGFSPDGKLMVSGSKDLHSLFKVWDVSTRQEIGPFTGPGHTNQVLGLAFSPDSKMLATGSMDRTVKLWDVSQRKLIASFPTLFTVFSVAISADGRTLAASGVGFGGGTTGIRFWDIASRQEWKALGDDTNEITSVAFSPDGLYAATGCGGGKVMLWDWPARKLLRSFNAHRDWAFYLTFSRDSKWIASCSWDATIRLYDVAKRQMIEPPLWGHLFRVSGVAFTPDGKSLASGSMDGTLRIWNLATRQVVLILKTELGPSYFAAFSPDGNLMASSSAEGSIRLWPAARLNESGRPQTGQDL